MQELWSLQSHSKEKKVPYKGLGLDPSFPALGLQYWEWEHTSSEASAALDSWTQWQYRQKEETKSEVRILQHHTVLLPWHLRSQCLHVYSVHTSLAQWKELLGVDSSPTSQGPHLFWCWESLMGKSCGISWNAVQSRPWSTQKDRPCPRGLELLPRSLVSAITWLQHFCCFLSPVYTGDQALPNN